MTKNTNRLIVTVESDPELQKDLYFDRAICIYKSDRPSWIKANTIVSITINNTTIPLKVRSKNSDGGKIVLFNQLLKEFGVKKGQTVTLDFARADQGQLEDWITSLSDPKVSVIGQISSLARTSSENADNRARETLKIAKEEFERARRFRWVGILMGIFGIITGLVGLLVDLPSVIFGL